MAKKIFKAEHMNNLVENISEVERLMEIHKGTAGSAPGYKHNLAVLNKSGIVLLVACWEAFIEDLAQNAFEFMLDASVKHTTFPNEVLTSSSKCLKNSKDNRDVWKLAGDGWKKVLTDHKSELFKNNIGKLNTPKPAQVDYLYKSLLGISSLSSKWKWTGMSVSKSKDKLTKLVELRGAIAHRVSTSSGVHKSVVEDHSSFIHLLAVKSSNAVSNHVIKCTGQEPWPPYMYGKIK